MGKASRTLMVLAGLAIAAAVTVSIFLIIQTRQATPLDSYQKQSAFQLYYPDTLPNGLKLDSNSITLSNDTLTMQFSNGRDTLTISQQAKPNRVSSLRLDGFTSVATPIGTMQLGTTDGQATGIITTDQSLINIVGASESTVRNVAESLSTVNP